MAQTIEQLIRQGKEREELLKEREALFKTAKKGIRKERIERFKGRFQKPQRVRPELRRRDVAVSSVARKAVSLVSPKGSLVRAITTPKKKGRGRGRPRGTYKARFVPGVGVVRVPTHIWKKMMAKAKADVRLARVQAQLQAEEISLQQDPRFQPTDDSFLTEQDQVHEFNVAQAQLQQEQRVMQYEQIQPIRQLGIARRVIRGVSSIGSTMSRLGRQPRMVDEFGRPIEAEMFPSRQVQDMRPRHPRVTAVTDRANILMTPNIFNKPGDSSILWKNRKRRLY